MSVTKLLPMATYVTADKLMGDDISPISAQLFNPFSSVAYGFALSAGLGTSLRYGGPFGYKTAIIGRTNSISRLTFGHAVLRTAEFVGQKSVSWFGNTKFSMWTEAASERGFASLSYGKVFDVKGKVTDKVVSKLKKEFLEEVAEKKSIWSKLLTGRDITELTEDAIDVVIKDKKVGLFPRLNKLGNVVFKAESPLGKIGLTSLNAALVAWTLADLISIPLSTLAKNTVNKIGNTMVPMLEDFLAMKRTRFGGYLGPAFSNRAAATERQRAVQAIYAAKVNPVSRMYGNEARMYHR